MKNEVIYCVHVFVHVLELKWKLLKGIISYNLKVLKENEIVQLLHVIKILVGLKFKRKKEKEKNKRKQQ